MHPVKPLAVQLPVIVLPLTVPLRVSTLFVLGKIVVMAIPKDVLDNKIVPQIPLNRLGKPDEVAGLIVYLCSEEAAFLTGANVSINGGQHMQ